MKWVSLRSGLWLAGIILLVAAGFRMADLKMQRDSSPLAPPSRERVRRSVGATTDAEAAKILRTPRPITLADIKSLAIPSSAGRAPFEMQVWRLQATVVEARIRADNDLYMVIEDQGRRGCVELPDPELCRDSPFLDQIRALRVRLRRELKLSSAPIHVGRRAELVGIGFFGTRSSKDNGARLMPLLDLQWR